MTTPANITLQVQVNGGGIQTGPIMVAHSDTIDLSVDNTAGINKYKWEIFEYPEGLTLADLGSPAGWAFDGNSIVSSDPSPSQFIVPASTLLWGKFFLRLIVNDSLRGGVFAADLTDERTALRVDSTLLGLEDTGFRETNQFRSFRQWMGAIKANWRALDGIATGGFAAPANPADDGKVVIASGGDFTYLAGGGSGEVLTWNGSAWVSATLGSLSLGWPDVLADDPSSGANNPSIASGQFFDFANEIDLRHAGFATLTTTAGSDPPFNFSVKLNAGNGTGANAGGVAELEGGDSVNGVAGISQLVGGAGTGASSVGGNANMVVGGGVAGNGAVNIGTTVPPSAINVGTTTGGVSTFTGSTVRLNVATTNPIELQDAGTAFTQWVASHAVLGVPAFQAVGASGGAGRSVALAGANGVSGTDAGGSVLALGGNAFATSDAAGGQIAGIAGVGDLTAAGGQSSWVGGIGGATGDGGASFVQGGSSSAEGASFGHGAQVQALGGTHGGGTVVGGSIQANAGDVTAAGSATAGSVFFETGNILSSGGTKTAGKFVVDIKNANATVAGAIEYRVDATPLLQWVAATPNEGEPGFVSTGGTTDGTSIAIETEAGITTGGSGGNFSSALGAGGATGDGGEYGFNAGRSSAAAADFGGGAGLQIVGGAHNAGLPVGGSITGTAGTLGGTAGGTAGGYLWTTGNIASATGTSAAGNFIVNVRNTNADTTGLVQFQENGTPFAAIGGNTTVGPALVGMPESGVFRVPKNVTIIAARNDVDGADIPVLATDGSNGIIIGGANGADITILRGAISVLTTTSSTTRLNATTTTQIATGGTNRMLLNTSGLQITNASSIFFDNAVTAPLIRQQSRSSGPTGELFTLHAQDITATSGTKTGGALLEHAGDVTGAGDSNTGGKNTQRGGNASGGTLNNGGDMAVLWGTGADLTGNITIGTDNTTWNSGEGILFVGDSTTVPTGDPTSGLYLYTESGAWKGRTAGGTITTIAAAAPHCPGCGRDVVVESENPDEGWKLSFCMWCFSDGKDPTKHANDGGCIIEKYQEAA